MCLRCFKRPSKGYSLAEILISIAVLGVGLLAVVGVFPVAISTLRIIGSRYFVVQQAQAQMEAVKSVRYSTLEQMANKGFGYSYKPLRNMKELRDPNNNFDLNADPNSATSYPGYWSEIPIIKDPNDPDGVLRIKVAIYWVESNAYGKKSTTEKKFVLDGYKARGIK
ncbi:MAG: prepilin-type N-terminal cleavage/methylation domain-containing protein [Candidatus Eremiobacterota bacterium]